MLFPILKGFVVGISLIGAIGPQNLFIIRQASTRSYALVSALTCSLCDALLVIIGALGLGSFIAAHPLLQTTMTVGGILFLLSYATLALTRAIKGTATHDHPQSAALLRTAVLTALALSLVNPHAFLDTAVLIGGVAANYDLLFHRALFAFGACLASFVWFFSLSFFAHILGPLLTRPATVRLLDALTAIIMLAIALSLTLQLG